MCYYLFSTGHLVLQEDRNNSSMEEHLALGEQIIHFIWCEKKGSTLRETFKVNH